MKIKHLRFKTFVYAVGVAMFLFATAFIVSNVKSTASKQSTHYYQSENEYLTSLRCNPATGTVSPADYAKACRDFDKFLKSNSTKSSDLTWETSGPDNLSGRVRVLLRDDAKSCMFLGSPCGGIWKVNDGSQVWQSLPSPAGDINVTCMIKASNGNYYAGTGESFYSEEFNLLAGFKGRGIYMSTDGENYTAIASTIPASTTQEGGEWFYINKLAESNGNLLAATNTSLKYSTTMTGEAWNIATTTDGTQLTGECTELIVSGNGVVFAFVNDLAYVSSTGSPTGFECVSTQYYGDNGVLNNEDMLPRDSIGRMSFAFAPSDPTYIYAIAIQKYDIASTKDFNERGSLKNIYRCIQNSDGSWSNWEVIGPGGSSHMFYVFQSNGLYSAAIAVDPNNPEIVYAGGTDLWKGNRVSNSELYQWTQLTTYENTYSIAYVPQNHFQYLINGTNCYIACENGVYMLGSNGRTSLFNTNLITSQFYTVSADYENNIYGGSQGNGTVAIYKAYGISGKSGINLHNAVGSSVGLNFGAFKIGGYVHNSMIYPSGTIISINGKDDLKDETQAQFADYAGTQCLTIYRFDDQVPQNISYWYSGGNVIKPIEDSASYITPSILYENFDYEYSKDSVEFVADQNYKAGDTVYAGSHNASYPIEVVLEEDLAEGQSIMVHDKVASRFFVGVNGSIFMTKEATNFNQDFANNNPWFTISSSKLNGISGTPQCMALSKDANYLFVGTKDGKLYRLSNIAYAYDETTASVGSDLYSTATPVLNPYCVIATTLIHTFENRVITSITINPYDFSKVVVTLGNYGFNDDEYVYLTTDALELVPNFTAIKSFAAAPIYTSLFVEGNDEADNMLLLGSDFGVISTNDITASEVVWNYEDSGLGELPVFMLKQQTVQTVDDNPIYVGDNERYITNHNAIYAATYGGGLFQCSDFLKPVNITPAGITSYKETNKVSIYPNPARENATISVDLQSTSDVAAYIYNINGQLVKVMSQRNQSGNVTFNINTSSMDTGTYIVKIITGEGTQSSKFIVVK